MLKDFCIATALIPIVLAVIVMGICGLDAKMCSDTADKMGYEHSWSFRTGCMIKNNGRWFPLRAFKVMGDLE